MRKKKRKRSVNNRSVSCLLLLSRLVCLGSVSRLDTCHGVKRGSVGLPSFRYLVIGFALARKRSKRRPQSHCPSKYTANM
uniref:Putative secreted protein n=1 Tax=Anopheles triannulatus TaxID=58253 RepID=A0A2M4B7V4_9DIPT